MNVLITHIDVIIKPFHQNYAVTSLNMTIDNQITYFFDRYVVNRQHATSTMEESPATHVVPSSEDPYRTKQPIHTSVEEARNVKLI